MAQYDGSINISSKIDESGFNAGTKSMSAGLSGLVGVLGKVAAAVGIAFGVGAIVNFLKQSAQLASSIQVMQNRFNTIFGGLAGTVKTQLTAIGDATNFCENDLMDLATTLQVAFLNLGYTSANAANTSVTAIKRVQDLATFWGTDVGTITQAIQMGMLGMTRGLRQYNVVIDESKIKAQAQAMGLWDGAGAMSAQAKAAATLQIILQQTSYAQGNAEKTAHTWAGEVRGLANAWEEFKVAVGNAVIIFAPVVAVIKTIIVWATALANEFAALIAMIFGIDVGANAATAGVQGAADAAGALADNTTAAGAAAKGALASFDQLNVLAQASGTGSTATPATPGAGGLAMPLPDTSAVDAVQAKVKAFYDAMMTFLAPVITAFDRLKAALEPLGETIWAGLKWAWDNILVPLGNWTITTLLPVFLDLLAAGATTLNTALIALKPLGQWLWDNFLQPLATWTGEAIIDGLKWVTQYLKDLGTWIGENQTTFDALVATFAAIALTIFLIETPVAAVIVAFGLLGAAIVTLNHYWPQISDAAWTAWDDIKTTLTPAAGWFKINVTDKIEALYGPMWTKYTGASQTALDTMKNTWIDAPSWFQSHVTDPIRALYGPMWTWYGNDSTTAWQTFTAVWIVANSWWQTHVTGPIGNQMNLFWDSWKQGASDTFMYLVTVWLAMSPWLQTYIFGPIGNQVSLFWEGWKTGFWDVYTAIATISGNIGDVLNTMLLGVINQINAVLAGLAAASGVHINPISTAPFTAGTAYKTTIHNLGAAGGVYPPNSPIATILGDQTSGYNVEAPSALIKQLVAEGIQQAGGGGGGDITITMPVYLDGEKIYVGQQKIQRRHGTSLIASGVTQ
jgi:hypothetical protein